MSASTTKPQRTKEQINAYLSVCIQEIGDALSLIGRALLIGERIETTSWGRARELLLSAAKRITESQSPPEIEMGSRINPDRYDCYHEALPDEPMFVLLGRDPTAPVLVRQWADQREADIFAGERPEEDKDKVLHARALASRMEIWRNYRMGAWRPTPKEETT